MVFGGGGEVGTVSYVALPLPESSPEKSFIDDILGFGFFRRVNVELPISWRIPLDCLLFADVGFCFQPDGDTFSASDEPGLPLADDQLLEGIDFGVTFRVGRAAPRNPALRSCSLLVCLELPGPESGGKASFSLSGCCRKVSNAGEGGSIAHRGGNISP